MFHNLQYILQSDNSHHVKNSDASYIIKNILKKKKNGHEKDTH